MAEYFHGQRFDEVLGLGIVNRRIDHLWVERAGALRSYHQPISAFAGAGWLHPPQAGKYKLAAVADDGVRVWIDGAWRIDHWQGKTPVRSEIELELPAEPLSLKVEYHQTDGTAECSLRWLPPAAAYETAIPDTAFSWLPLDAAAASTPALPPVNLLDKVDVAKNAIKGKWTKDKSLLSSDRATPATLAIPYAPPAEYDLVLEATRDEGNDCLVLGLVAGGRQFGCGFDVFAKEPSLGLELVDGKRLDRPDNPTRRTGTVVLTGKRQHIQCVVRKNRLLVFLDGKRKIDWSGDWQRLSNCEQWAIPNPRGLYLCTWGSKYRIHKLELTPYRELCSAIALNGLAVLRRLASGGFRSPQLNPACEIRHGGICAAAPR